MPRSAVNNRKPASSPRDARAPRPLAATVAIASEIAEADALAETISRWLITDISGGRKPLSGQSMLFPECTMEDNIR